jgi:hypothetical protein
VSCGAAHRLSWPGPPVRLLPEHGLPSPELLCAAHGSALCSAWAAGAVPGCPGRVTPAHCELHPRVWQVWGSGRCGAAAADRGLRPGCWAAAGEVSLPAAHPAPARQQGEAQIAWLAPAADLPHWPLPPPTHGHACLPRANRLLTDSATHMHPPRPAQPAAHTGGCGCSSCPRCWHTPSQGARGACACLCLAGVTPAALAAQRTPAGSWAQARSAAAATPCPGALMAALTAGPTGTCSTLSCALHGLT